MDEFRKNALKALQRIFCRLLALAANQVSNRLQLNKVHLSIKKSAFAELSWPCHPSTKCSTRSDGSLYNNRSTVSLKFNDVVASKRLGRLEE